MKKIIVILSVFTLALITAGASTVKVKQKKLTYRQKLERRIHVLVNAERKKHGLKPFIKSARLSRIARAHSRDMIKRDYTSHNTPEGLDPSGRAKKAGYNIEKKMGNMIRVGVGENIFETQSTKSYSDGRETGILQSVKTNAEKCVSGWMKSPPHRKNILDKTYTLAGVGVSISKDKVVKATQMYF